MIVVRLFVALLVLMFFTPSAWSGTLSEKDVRGFVESMRELKPYFEQYADETGDDGDASSTAQIVTDWAQGLKQQHEFEGMLSKHGFNYDSWAVVSQQVTQAYMALKFGKDGKDVVGQMRQSMEEIEANPDLPAETKAEMVKQMRQSMAEMEKTFSASTEDQDAVKPFVADLDSIFEWQE
jgi:uncharacterized protein YecA (UPF0149 family)